MDIFLVILVVIMLISAFGFYQDLPPVAPTWNPLEWFFQHQLGWSIEFTSLFCFGFLVVVFLVMKVWGRLMGMDKKYEGDDSELTYEQLRHNAFVKCSENLDWFAKVAGVGIVILITFAWLVGKFSH